MTILERKAEFIRQILTETDDSKFERLESIFASMSTERLPGQETVEEMREGVRRATRAYKEGTGKFISNEEALAKLVQ
ncbi:MAG: hypothetical protein LIP05_14955 [Tannerellaceae bacterium]|nr:hypothetical protein [Tannerellaceae bacterium]MCC8199405.1 hypothetical protein [Tannerellaceae bacterium]